MRDLVHLCAIVPEVGETLGTVMADTVQPEQGRSELALTTRTTMFVEWPTSHSPFFSRPDLVADLQTGLARET